MTKPQTCDCHDCQTRNPEPGEVMIFEVDWNNPPPQVLSWLRQMVPSTKEYKVRLRRLRDGTEHMFYRDGHAFLGQWKDQLN